MKGAQGGPRGFARKEYRKASTGGFCGQYLLGLIISIMLTIGRESGVRGQGSGISDQAQEPGPRRSRPLAFRLESLNRRFRSLRSDPLIPDGRSLDRWSLTCGILGVLIPELADPWIPDCGISGVLIPELADP